MAKEKKVKEYQTASEVDFPQYVFRAGAVQIKEIKNIGSESDPNSAGDGSKIINNSFTVSLAFVQEHNPEVGDYITVNEDGELNCFTQEYFEDNFTKLK